MKRIWGLNIANDFEKVGIFGKLMLIAAYILVLPLALLLQFLFWITYPIHLLHVNFFKKDDSQS